MNETSQLELEQQLAQWDEQYGQQEAAEDTSIRRYAPGRYRFRVVSHSLYKSSNDNIAFRVMCTAVNGPEVGGRLPYDFWLSEAGWPFAMRDISKVFGVNITRRTEVAQLDLVGAEFCCVVADDEYQGKNGPVTKSVMKFLEKAD